VLHAVDRFLSEAGNFLNPHALFQSDNNEVDTTKFNTMYADEVDLSELPVEIEGFMRLVQSSVTTFQSDGTALDVLQ